MYKCEMLTNWWSPCKGCLVYMFGLYFGIFCSVNSSTTTTTTTTPGQRLLNSPPVFLWQPPHLLSFQSFQLAVRPIKPAHLHCWRAVTQIGDTQRYVSPIRAPRTLNIRDLIMTRACGKQSYSAANNTYIYCNCTFVSPHTHARHIFKRLAASGKPGISIGVEERERMTPKMCSLITPMQGSACRSVGGGPGGREAGWRRGGGMMES